MEFQLRDGVLGLFKSDVKTVRFPIASIEEISLDRVWSDPLHLLGFGSWHLRVRTLNFNSMVDIPGHEEDGFRLRVSRRYPRVAQALLSEVELRMAEIRLSEVETLSSKDGRS